MNEIKAKLAELTALTRKVMKRQHDELDEQIHNLATEIAGLADSSTGSAASQRIHSIQPTPLNGLTAPAYGTFRFNDGEGPKAA